ncbi:MAG: hypothetical protein H3C68_00950 [Deltaproteobacteria bacterium]|nr:hypothetical protein [Deltaproteobacteria bacterium]MBZ0219179.1 hypothetical protein [Deltaproteobacteria bacterium]
MTSKKTSQKPWIAIVWFGLWGIFQTYVVFSVINGSWERPAAFPEEAYNAIIYPDMFFIPLYLIASILLFRGHFMGNIIGLIAGGAVIYIMIYLIALSGLKGIENLFFDTLFLVANLLAILQIMRMALMTRPGQE